MMITPHPEATSEADCATVPTKLENLNIISISTIPGLGWGREM